jgi:hypothetical protein
LGEGLIAIVGENGASKSTLIGSIFAALCRQLPGQKRSLYAFATHPEGIHYETLFRDETVGALDAVNGKVVNPRRSFICFRTTDPSLMFVGSGLVLQGAGRRNGSLYRVNLNWTGGSSRGQLEGHWQLQAPRAW